LVHRSHDAVRHESLNYINCGDTEKVTEFLHRERRRDGDGPGS
jgi:hypothetical protein